MAMIIAKNYLLGMDLGTTNMKAIILDEDGNVAAQASRPNYLIFPGPNCVEQDANVWWSNAVEIFRELSQKTCPEVISRIRGICVSSQTVTMLPVDKEGNPLRNAVIWMDNRSTGELRYILNEIGFDRFVGIVGGQPDVTFLPNKILWFKKNEPELFAKTEKVLQASSFINYKLTGKMTMDLDQAARCQCLDISALKWSDEIAKVIGTDFEKILPPLYAVNEVIGKVTPEAAAETGLIHGIPVVAGASDAMASMYATGLVKLGEAGESSGTSSLVFVGSDHASATDIPVVTKPCAIDGMPYVFDGPITTSGAAVKWFLDNMCIPEKQYADEHGISVYDYINQLSLNVPAGSNGVLFFPYLLGERAPYWNNHAKGMFIGMSSDTTRNDLIRSVFEGTAFALRHVMDTIKQAGGAADRLRINGGGARSRTWCMIKASMLKMPVCTLDDRSGDVPFGDCLIVGNTVGIFPDLTATIEKLIRIEETIEPVEEWADAYDKLYPFFLDMYRHLDEDLKKYREVQSLLKRD